MPKDACIYELSQVNPLGMSGSPKEGVRKRYKSKSRSRSHSRKRSRSRSRSRRRSRSRERRSRTRSNDRRDRSPSDDGYRLHVADLEANASKRDIEKVFGKYGPLKEIWMARSVPCFAFIVYRHKDDAEEASRMADGVDIAGRRIRVSFARPRTKGHGRRSFDPNMRCYQCGDRGHFSRDCGDLRQDRRSAALGDSGSGKRPSYPEMARGGGATVALYVAHVLATLIFLVGFFPAKTPIQGGAKPEDILRGAQIGNDYSVLAIRDGWTRRKVGQVVIVLIDALRADFVLDHAKLREHEVDYGPIGEMPKLEFLRRKISQREAACYIAQATPPTVTLPRIKVADAQIRLSDGIPVISDRSTHEILSEILLLATKRIRSLRTP
eukprot:snap_masked-scaffold375_size191602-processed-gene-0.22 protein:Tk05047 transcript:snap_masked-scaffold375_size191602-processed-gene-0.22-mRNA-1 annotation:"splicing arginine serine-rich 7"